MQQLLLLSGLFSDSDAAFRRDKLKPTRRFGIPSARSGPPAIDIRPGNRPVPDVLACFGQPLR